MSQSQAVLDDAWRALGCKAARRVHRGRAAWRLRARRRSPGDWAIEASHCPYLGKPPYEYGDDAWRISIQTVSPNDLPVEDAHLVARSEAEALAAVQWLDAVAGEERRS